MKTIFLIQLSILLFSAAYSQNVIKGTVTDDKENPIPGANVFIKDTYFGTSTDSSGSFYLEFSNSGMDTLIVCFLGYEDYERQIAENFDLRIVLTESTNNINAVVITAGSFDASDEKKSVTMQPIDIVTTASGEGDIYGALNTMPGTQKVGEQGGLFVRGGEGHESKTYMDGLLVQNPYTSSMPDLPMRGRLSPFLFEGTVFSTGGYSAEYGQALSSSLILNTKDLADHDITEINLLSLGASASHTKRLKKSSFTFSVDYTNLAPYNSITEHNVDWIKSPESMNGMFIFRQKVNTHGLIKTYGSYNRSVSELLYPNYEIGTNQNIRLRNDDMYINSVYDDMLTKKLKIKAGFSYNLNNDNIDIDDTKVNTDERSWQSVLNFKYFMNDDRILKFGAQILNTDYNQTYFDSFSEDEFSTNFLQTIYSSFVEGEIKFTSKFAARAGVRFEYYSLLNNFSVSPRISIAAKTGKYSQLSIAYGIFDQSPLNDYLKFNKELIPEKAAHYILNYQYVKTGRTFRVEAYYKDYSNLVKYESLNLPVKESYNNKGYGYSRGFDIFWRDRRTFKLIDYRISYSFLDTERDYLNYSQIAVPTYASKHNMHFVYKQWVNKISTYLGVTYSYSSGRTFFNPNNPEFLKDKTKNFHDLSFNASYLTKLLRNQLIIHLSVSNVLGFDHVYGYRYSGELNGHGFYDAHPIMPGSKRFILLVLMYSFK